MLVDIISHDCNISLLGQVIQSKVIKDIWMSFLSNKQETC